MVGDAALTARAGLGLQPIDQINDIEEAATRSDADRALAPDCDAQRRQKTAGPGERSRTREEFQGDGTESAGQPALR